jgi:DNA-binding transcriptional MocR family regulator
MGNHSTRWVPAIRDGNKPAYQAIADAIAEDIQSGRLAASQLLPTMRHLAKVLDLNFTTVARGYAEAHRRGLIDSKAGRGTFVRQIVRSQAVRTPSSFGLIDMTMNMPPEPQDPSILQMLRVGFSGLAELADPFSVLRYQEFGGTPHDRDAGARWLGRSVPGVPAQRVLVCPGVQSALLALFTVLGRPGDTICCESVTYPGIKGIAAHLGIRLKGLPADDEGIDPDAFAAACAVGPPKALYVNPTLLNPTTAVMSQQRREAVAAIAQRYSVPIIEDDAYARLPSRAPPPLATLIPELTFYITGFAKCIGAGLRVAYTIAPNVRYAARLAATLRTTVVMPTTLAVALATRWIDDGTAEAVASAVREESRIRQTMAAEILGRARYVSKPEAFHLWLNVPEPWNRVEFATHLRSHRVGVVLSDTFTVADAPPEAVRVCLGGPVNREECRHSLEIIADALEHLPALSSRAM